MEQMEQRGDTEWVKFLNWTEEQQVLVHRIVLSIKFTGLCVIL